MSLNLRLTRRKLYPKVPRLGVFGTAQSVDTDGITDPIMFQDSGAGAGDFANMILVRPNRSLPDYYAPTGEVVSGKLFITGQNYSNVSDLEYELVGLLHPDELNDCIRRALHRVYFQTEMPLSFWDTEAGGDLFGTVTADASLWTPRDVGGVSTMSTLASNKLTGYATLNFANSVALGYTETPSLYVSPGDRLYTAAINRVTGYSQTASYRLMGYINGAWTEIGSALTHSERAWQHLRRSDTVPSGCYEVRARLQGVESSAVVQWDCLPGHDLDWRRFDAPTWLNAGYKLLDFGQAEYGRVIAASGTGQREPARSRQLKSWKRPSDFELEVMEEEANPQGLQVNRDEGLPAEDMWFVGLRPYSDRGELDDETETTEAVEQYFIPACLAELGEVLSYRLPEEPQWAAMWQTNERKLAAQRGARSPSLQRPQQTMYTPGGRRGRQSS